MQFQVPYLKVGQEVKAEVKEVFVDQSALVSFQGDLVLLQNHSQHQFQIGEKLILRVTAVQPLAFQWRQIDATGLDVVI